MTVSGRASSIWCRLTGCWSGSGEELDVPVGVEEDLGGGPAVDDPDDLSAGPTHESSRGVEERPAQCLRPGVSPGEVPPASRTHGYAACCRLRR